MLILRCFSIFSERALCISRRRYSCRPRDSCDEPEASSRCEHLQMVKIVKGDDLQLATVAAVAVTLSGNCWLSWRREQETIWIHFLHWFDFDVERESQANCIKTVNKYESIHNIVQTYTEWHIEWQRQSKNAQWQNAATSLHRPEWRMTPVTPIPIQSFQSFQEASPTTRLWQRQGKKGGFRVGFGWLPRVFDFAAALRSLFEVLEAIRTLRTPTEWLALWGHSRTQGYTNIFKYVKFKRSLPRFEKKSLLPRDPQELWVLCFDSKGDS